MRYFAQLLHRSAFIRGLLVSGIVAGGASKVVAQDERQINRKLAPTLAGRSSAAQKQAVRISVARPAEFRAWAKHNLPAAKVHEVAGGKGTLLLLENITGAQVQQLSAVPGVNFVDQPNRRAYDERQLDQSDMSVNRITTAHTRFPQLAGQGLTVSIKEDSFDPTDIDFRGRVVSSGLFKASASPHATAVATLVAGGGNSAPTGKGVAWQARLATSSYASLLPDDGAVLAQTGVSVQNHSYGVAAIENYYGLESQAYDQQCQQYPSLVHVFSSGNLGTQTSREGRYAGIANVANLTGQFKTSKNTLTVGATDALGKVAPLSSRGPAYDGRLKPELVAYGAGGTSEAAALVSGSSLLVQQAYQLSNGGALPPAALVKAALLNSADDTGRPGVDFETGFGQVDAAGAVQTVQDRRFFQGSVTQNAQRSYSITVPAGQQELKVTLAWSDPEASPAAAQALVHDLDLELVHVASGRRWQPWVLSSFPHADSLALLPKRRADRLNNVEQVSLAVPEPGDYLVHVRGTSVAAAQAFGLAYEYSAGFSWVSPAETTNLVPGTTGILRWQWAGPAATGRLEYQALGSSKWRSLQSSVPLSQSNFIWAVPDTTTLAQVRMLIGDAGFVSSAFTITNPTTPTVGYTCEEETLILWPRTAGAQQYQVYRLGQTQLEPYLVTADTALVLNKEQMQNLYYAVEPIFGNIRGARGTTIDFTQQGTACYIKSFLPRTVVTDTVVFDLEVGSTYRLKAVTLERLTPNGPQPVQTVDPVTARQIAFLDSNAPAGRSEYRLRLDLLDGKVIYSDTEAVQFVRPNEVQVYPNPVVAGQPLQLLTAESTDSRIQLYDITGRLLREITESGAIKSVSTAGLAKGLYLLRVRTGTGPVVTTRVVVL